MLDLKEWISKVTNTIKNLPKLTYNSITVTKNVALASSGSIAAGGNCAVITTTVTVPSGYKLVWSMMRGTQNANTYCWYWDWDDTHVYYRLRNVGSSAVTTSPTADLFFVKVGGVVRKLLNTLKTLASERRWVTC